MTLPELVEELGRVGVTIHDVTETIGDLTVAEIRVEGGGVTIDIEPPAGTAGTVTEAEMQQAHDHCAGWRCGQCPLTMSAEEADDSGGEPPPGIV